MIDGFEMNWSDNLKDLKDAMKELPEKVSDSILRSVNRKLATKYIVQRLRSGLPYSPTSKKHIKVQAVRGEPTAVSAGPTREVFWWRFVEGGTKERRGRGSITAQNRIGPIIDTQVPPMADEWNQEVGNLINEFLEKRIRNLERKL